LKPLDPAITAQQAEAVHQEGRRGKLAGVALVAGGAVVDAVGIATLGFGLAGVGVLAAGAGAIAYGWHTFRQARPNRWINWPK